MSYLFSDKYFALTKPIVNILKGKDIDENIDDFTLDKKNIIRRFIEEDIKTEEIM